MFNVKISNPVFLTTADMMLQSGRPAGEAIDLLTQELYNVRKQLSTEEWQHFVMIDCRQHPVMELLQQDPFIWRALNKPRGYAGDGETLDFIFAPEDVQDLKTPYPLPPEDRILYVSTVAREDAGAEEAFVIRLLQKQLEHFQVSSAVSNEGNLDDTRLATAIERTWDFKDRLKDRLKARLREEQERTEEFQREAQKKVQHLNAIPKHLQNDGLINSRLLIKGKRELADNLKPAQDQVVGRGLERLKTRKTVLRLRLLRSELKDLGLMMQEGKLVGTINTEQLSEKARAVINGFDLVRKRGLNNPSPEALIKKYLLATPVALTGKDDTHKR